jgi:hypothetical protein
MYKLGLPNLVVAAAGVTLGIAVYGACVIALRGITPGELKRLPGGSFLLRQLVRLRIWPAEPADRG